MWLRNTCINTLVRAIDLMNNVCRLSPDKKIYADDKDSDKLCRWPGWPEPSLDAFGILVCLRFYDYLFWLFVSVCLFIPQYLSGDGAFTLLNLETPYLILCKYVWLCFLYTCQKIHNMRVIKKLWTTSAISYLMNQWKSFLIRVCQRYLDLAALNWKYIYEVLAPKLPLCIEYTVMDIIHIHIIMHYLNILFLGC